jgi:hypothetical protein
MATVNRYYSSTAVDTTLAVGISASATTMTVSSVTGFPTSYPYTLAVDYDTSLEELVNVVGASGTTLTLGTTVGVADITGRGVDQGAGYRVAHNAGAVVKHVISGRDVREPQEHIAATTSVHGIADTSALITASSTTIMTNKSLTAPIITGVADVTAGTLALGTTGSITANSTTISATELGYVDGATSNLQTQINTLSSTKAPIDAPTFTGVVTIPTGASITTPTITGGTVSGVTLSGTTTATSGTIALGTNTAAITANSNTVKSEEVGYLAGVTSSIQSQIAGKMTTPGAWTTVTPTVSGGTTNVWAIGNGTATMSYTQVGKIVHFKGSFKFGSTTVVGDASLTINLPVTGAAADANSVWSMLSSGRCNLSAGTSVSDINGNIVLNQISTTQFQPYVLAAKATPPTAVTKNSLSRTTYATSPTTGDIIIFAGTYEAA